MAHRSIVFYYSRMGDTKNAAEAVAHGLRAHKEAVWNANPALVSELDLAVFGTGVYLGKPSKEMLDFIDRLPQANGRKAAIFTISWALDAGALSNLRKRLEAKGYSVVAETNKRRWFMGIRDDDRDLVEFGRTLFQQHIGD